MITLQNIVINYIPSLNYTAYFSLTTFFIFRRITPPNPFGLHSFKNLLWNYSRIIFCFQRMELQFLCRRKNFILLKSLNDTYKTFYAKIQIKYQLNIFNLFPPFTFLPVTSRPRTPHVIVRLFANISINAEKPYFESHGSYFILSTFVFWLGYLYIFVIIIVYNQLIG